jgi:hypothetical protein
MNFYVTLRKQLTFLIDSNRVTLIAETITNKVAVVFTKPEKGNFHI